MSGTGNLLCGASVHANTDYHQLCQSGADEAVASGMQPLMDTDAETLMREGCATGRANFERFLSELKWERADISKTICHQVGPTHQKSMFEALEMNLDLDYTTVEWLGNTGSVALPTTMAIGSACGHLQAGDRVGLFGIGSGINCVMMGCDWQKALVHHNDELPGSVVASN